MSQVKFRTKYEPSERFGRKKELCTKEECEIEDRNELIAYVLGEKDELIPFAFKNGTKIAKLGAKNLSVHDVQNCTNTTLRLKVKVLQLRSTTWLRPVLVLNSPCLLLGINRTDWREGPACIEL